MAGRVPTPLAALVFVAAAALSHIASGRVYAAEAPSPDGGGGIPKGLLGAEFGAEVAVAIEGAPRAHDDFSMQYEPAFVGVGRDIIGRQETAYVALENNIVNTNLLDAGTTLLYRFANSSLWGNFSEDTPGLPVIAGRRLLSRGNVEMELRRRDSGEGDEEWDDVLGRRQDTAQTRQVYVSMNTCKQPADNGTATQDAPPQLTLYISTSDTNKSPGPDADSSLQDEYGLTGGFVNATVNASSNVYMGVAAPSPLPDGFSGNWQFQIAASIDASFHQYNYRDPADAFIFLVDTDTTSALFVTDNLTSTDPGDDDYERWMNAGNPFQLFAYSHDMATIRGLERSYCGLLNAWNDEPTSQVSGMTTRGLGHKPKEQFYVQGLNGSTRYHGFPVMWGNSTYGGSGVVGGGGQVWSPVNFTTKADGNCQVIFNLTFCSEVAYAVPANERLHNMTALRALYDDYAAQHYRNFDYSLQQIPCNTTTTAQYSLARTCDDCAHDYRNWLCAVTIPRCEDFSSRDGWLQPRNIGQAFPNGTRLWEEEEAAEGETTAGANDERRQQWLGMRDRLYANSSRNRMIDELVQPGPYNEVLPCDDLCYSLVQSCPASFAFACPLPGRGLEKSYGNRVGNGAGNVTCSYLGAVYYVNAAADDAGVLARCVVVVAAAVGAVVAWAPAW